MIALVCEVHFDLMVNGVLDTSPANVELQHGDQVLGVYIDFRSGYYSHFAVCQPGKPMAIEGVYDATRGDDFDAAGGYFVEVRSVHRQLRNEVKQILLAWFDADVTLTVQPGTSNAIAHRSHVRFSRVPA